MKLDANATTHQQFFVGKKWRILSHHMIYQSKNHRKWSLPPPLRSGNNRNDNKIATNGDGGPNKADLWIREDGGFSDTCTKPLDTLRAHHTLPRFYIWQWCLITIKFLLTSAWIWEKTWGCEKGAVGEKRWVLHGRTKDVYHEERISKKIATTASHRACTTKNYPPSHGFKGLNSVAQKTLRNCLSCYSSNS